MHDEVPRTGEKNMAAPDVLDAKGSRLQSRGITT
jgi:hypothetical protein